MKCIAHRRNTIEQLKETPVHYGVEIDLRSSGDRLILHHDPFASGDDFDAWLDHFRHGTLILNVKEEGLEARVLRMMRERGIEDFFFLDQSFPFLLKTATAGERRCAVRVSEYERVEAALDLAHLIDWVWVDCFTRFPLSGEDARRLRASGLRLCVVSPELQQRMGDHEIPALRARLARESIVADAVCTKWPERWSD